MIIFPAIDIKDGKVVRLLQGKFDQVTEYALDPFEIAKKWIADGALWLHIVDLDGAKTGVIQNKEKIIKIAQSVNVPIQMGGGVRSAQNIKELIDGGVSRVILGTKVIDDKIFLKEMLDEWKEKIAVSLDCHNGFVAQRGWTSTSSVRALDLVNELETMGLQCLIYTDIARDGMLTGPNYAELEKILAATKIPVIASGGVAHIDDIKRLNKLTSQGLLGAITGKAIYEGKLSLKEALALC
ncbi:MAG: 1-(5-phosphoribosyl)-5-[(5-phosphoribosylamino)methylideneamino]imidazole-4-carboxamide isomerase [Candidatus Omnitrophica bacterium]|nr:1-(5-phosphoribosyl)-5-[(5-phosphoribosylamino)methylideneamino]imidazole-4-carboxamide isomerase [Candidatus Omnitrophota bacterium]